MFGKRIEKSESSGVKSEEVGNYWKKVIFSDESQIVLGTNNRVYI